MLFFPVIMYECELDHKEDNTGELTLSDGVMEKTLESPLDSKEIKTVNPKGNQS